MDYAKESLRLHEQWKGKIEVITTVPVESKEDLSLAYTPGVAQPCLEIQKDVNKSYELTRRHNLCAVITDGSAVLGLGDIGPEAGMPVMEGKCVLFKAFGGVDAFPLCVKTHDVDEFVNAVYLMSGSFGGINLEDIKAPECFEIEDSLRRECTIPIMHDDQHGTAIISAAGLLNALEIQGKHIGSATMVVNGAGAAAMACTNLYVALGMRRENIIMCDSKGVVTADRTDLNAYKRHFATQRTDIRTLADAVRGADIFLGLSVADVLTPDMVRTMAPRPIVFALANPNPEISYEAAMASRDDIVCHRPL